MSKFSVVIPTCDRPDFLRLAVDSVLAQRNVDFEIVVVNDGAQSVNIQNDPRLTVLDNQRLGQVSARNRGTTAAQGDFIAFLDDDDQWTDEFFLSKVEVILQTGIDLCFADGKMRFLNGAAPVNFAFEASPESLTQNNTILLSTVCYRKSLHSKLGNFDENLPYYWDWDWYLRITRAECKIQRLAENVVAISVHHGNVSGVEHIQERTENLKLLCKKHELKNVVLKNHLDFVRS